MTGSFAFKVIVASSVNFATLTAPYCKSTPPAPATVIAPTDVLKLDAKSPAIVIAPVPSTSKLLVPNAIVIPPAGSEAFK